MHVQFIKGGEPKEIGEQQGTRDRYKQRKGRRRRRDRC